MERQQVLDDRSGPRIEAIIDEASLRRRIGGTALTAAQLRHLGRIAHQGRWGSGRGGVALRHSHEPDEAVIVYTRAEWDAFIGGVKHREFDFDGR